MMLKLLIVMMGFVPDFAGRIFDAYIEIQVITSVSLLSFFFIINEFIFLVQDGSETYSAD